MNNSRMHVEEQLCFALYSATNAVIRTYRPWLREIGLTYPQYLVLLVLWQNGEQTMGEIATRLSLPPGGVTPIVERLEAAELVVRSRDDGDRRVVHVTLTDAGKLLEKPATDAQSRVLCAAQMPEEKLEQLKATLKELTDHLSAWEADELVPADAATVAHSSGPGTRQLPGD